MSELRVEACASCGAWVIHAVHERTLKPSVIDVAAGTDGDIVIRANETGVMPTYRILDATKRFGRSDLHKSHFATCPQASTWRRRRT